jgi:hypothetical protein
MDLVASPFPDKNTLSSQRDPPRKNCVPLRAWYASLASSVGSSNIFAAFDLDTLTTVSEVRRSVVYFNDAIVARTRGSILSCRRKACFSPGESSSSSLTGLPCLLLGVNLDLSRAVIELVVDVLRIEEASEAFDCLRSGLEVWLEDMFVGLDLVSKRVDVA